MNKLEFLKSLENALCGIPTEEIQKSLDFYSEMIDDRIEDGVLEKTAVSQIGDVAEIAEQILADTPITKLVKQKIKPNHRMGAGEIALLVLGSPIWFPLLISVIAVIFSVYVSFWAVVISLWACEAAFLGCILGGIASTVILLMTGQNIFAAFIMIAATLFFIGFSILFFFICKYTSKGMIWITKKFTLFIKFLLLRKERV